MTEPLTFTGAPWTPEPGAINFLPEEDDRGFTEDEAYAFLSGGMDAVNALQAALTAAVGQAHTGAMIALVPSREDVVELVIDDETAEPLEELHITVVYLGEAVDVDVETREELITQLTDLATNQPVIVGEIIGFTVLNPDGPEPCLVANVSGPDVEAAHDAIIELLDDTAVSLPPQHRPWLAHLTLGYSADPRTWLIDDLMGKTGLISIDRIRVAFGGVVTDIPLGHPALVAAEAFHLPGKHSQKSHGHGGGAPLTRISGKDLKKRRKEYDEKVKTARTGGAAYTAAPRGENANDPEMEAALANYSGSVGYHDVNEGLRVAGGNADTVVKPPDRGIPGNPSPHADSAAVQDTIHTMDHGMESSPLQEDVVVHRVISDPGRTFGDSYSRTGDNSGLAFRDHGFASTTTGGEDHLHMQYVRLRGGIDEKSVPTVTMRIVAPRGTPALRGTWSEQEVILDRGLGLRVVADHGVDPDWNTHNLDVEVIQ